LLLCGWGGLFQGVLSWLANPAIVAGWLTMMSNLRKAPQFAIAYTTLSLVFALSFLFYREIDQTGMGMAPDRIGGYGLGYWLWVTSTAIAFVGSIVAIYIPPTKSEASQVSLTPSPDKM